VQCHWRKTCKEPVEKVVTIQLLSIAGPAVLEYTVCRVHAEDAVATARATGRHATVRTIDYETT
jgi:hypothetical protein